MTNLHVLNLSYRHKLILDLVGKKKNIRLDWLGFYLENDQYPTNRAILSKAKYFEITHKIGHIQFCSDPLRRGSMRGKPLIVGMKIPQGTAISQTLIYII